MNVSRMLRLEGLILLASALAVYALLGGNWLLFVVLLLAPDLSLIGYLVNQRTGALAYDVVHIYLLPGVLLALGFAFAVPLVMQIAVIWFAHIGMDRTVGFGLRYPTESKITHLQRV